MMVCRSLDSRSGFPGRNWIRTLEDAEAIADYRVPSSNDGATSSNSRCQCQTGAGSLPDVVRRGMSAEAASPSSRQIVGKSQLQSTTPVAQQAISWQPFHHNDTIFGRSPLAPWPDRRPSDTSRTSRTQHQPGQRTDNSETREYLPRGTCIKSSPDASSFFFTGGWGSSLASHTLEIRGSFPLHMREDHLRRVAGRVVVERPRGRQLKMRRAHSAGPVCQEPGAREPLLSTMGR